MKQRNNPEEKLSTKSMDFSIVLAGCIHDVKNSLSILINRVAEVSAAIEDGENRLALEQLQYQGKRINSHLIQLLVLYRIDQAQYFANISETGIRDLIADTLDPYIPMFTNKNITVSVCCSDDLYWYIDSDLIQGVLVNIMNNLYIYAESRIEIAAWQENQTFVLQIKDDGPGYPDEVFDVSMRDAQKRFSFKSSNTGLGLFFSEMAAEMHQNSGKKGYITMSNDGIDGGGCFSIVLP